MRNEECKMRKDTPIVYALSNGAESRTPAASSQPGCLDLAGDVPLLRTRSSAERGRKRSKTLLRGRSSGTTPGIGTVLPTPASRLPGSSRDAARGTIRYFGAMPLSLLKLSSLRPWFLHAVGPALIAAIAWGWIVTHLDPGGSDPTSGEGPGLTIDESFNVQNGVLLVEAWRNYGIALIFPESARDVFHPREGLYLNDHPPLGRFWLGLHHHVAWWWKAPLDPQGPCVTARARTGSATAFALTILLLGMTASVWYGRTVGVLTALMYATIPRVIGHAHIASLETFTNLTYTAAVIAIAAGWGPTIAPNKRSAAWTGAVYGLALLSKMQAVFIPIPFAVWALVRWRHRAVLPLVIWGLAAFVVFFIGWPTHWFEPWVSIPKYFRGAADRAALSVWFNGMHYTDKTVPLMYVLMTFLQTVPVVIPLLVMLGAWARWRGQRAGAESSPVAPRQESQAFRELPSPTAILSRSDRATSEWLILMEAVFPLVMFSLPRVPVYDAERLWLPAIPLLVLSAAAGLALLLNWARSRNVVFHRYAIASAVLVVSAPLINAASVAPCFLSSYESYEPKPVGLAMAERSGQELDYWGCAITRSLLTDVVQKVPRGSTIAVAPVLHQFQVEELFTQSPILRAYGVKLVAYDPAKTPTEYVLVFRRRADLDAELEARLRDGPRLSEVVRQGVVLAGLIPTKRAD